MPTAGDEFPLCPIHVNVPHCDCVPVSGLDCGENGTCCCKMVDGSPVEACECKSGILGDNCEIIGKLNVFGNYMFTN